MKTQLTIVLALFIGLMSCTKDKSPDYRDIVTGNYSGIRVNSYWHMIDTVAVFEQDTTTIILTLTKSEIDSVIDLSFNPYYSNQEYSFKFKDGQLTSLDNYHAPTIKLINDSLYFNHQPGLGPYWVACFTKKKITDFRKIKFKKRLQILIPNRSLNSV